MNNLHMSEILSSKYDVHLDYQITMYDQLPYKRNADLCGEQKYRQRYSETHYKILNMRDKQRGFFRGGQPRWRNKKNTSRRHCRQVPRVNTPTVEDISDNEDDMPEGISQKQVQTLLDD